MCRTLVASSSNNMIRHIIGWATYNRYFLTPFSFIHPSCENVCKAPTRVYSAGRIFDGIKCNARECRTKDEKFSRRGKLRQCCSFCPAVSLASIENGDKRKVVKNKKRTIFSGRRRNRKIALTVGRSRRKAHKTGISFLKRERKRKERERERRIHPRRTRVCKERAIKLVIPR